MPDGSLGHCVPGVGVDTVTAHTAELLLYDAVIVADPFATPVISNRAYDCPIGTTTDAGTDAIAPFVDEREIVEFTSAGPDRLTCTDVTVLVFTGNVAGEMFATVGFVGVPPPPVRAMLIEICVLQFELLT